MLCRGSKGEEKFEKIDREEGAGAGGGSERDRGRAGGEGEGREVGKPGRLEVRLRGVEVVLKGAVDQ